MKLTCSGRKTEQKLKRKNEYISEREEEKERRKWKERYEEDEKKI